MPAIQPVSRRSLQRSDQARGEIHCDSCGYGAVVAHLPARCPMCGSTVWVEHTDCNLGPSWMGSVHGRLPEPSEAR